MLQALLERSVLLVKVAYVLQCAADNLTPVLMYCKHINQTIITQFLILALNTKHDLVRFQLPRTPERKRTQKRNVFPESLSIALWQEKAFFQKFFCMLLRQWIW